MECSNGQSVSRQRTQLTPSRRSIPDIERFSQAMKHRCSCFAPIARSSPYLPLTHRNTSEATALQSALGKLGEYSDKSGPRIGNLAESSDKVETMELIAHQKRTLLRQWMKICIASFLWKSALFFSHESDCGNRVRTFTREKFG